MRLLTTVLLSAAVASGLPVTPVVATSAAEVDEACADSLEAFAGYKAARAGFAEAYETLEQAIDTLDQAEHKAERIRSSFENSAEDRDKLRGDLEEQAAVLYMQAVTAPAGGVARLTSPDKALTALEFLGMTTGQSSSAIADLAAKTSELETLGTDLDAAVAHLAAARDNEARQTAAAESAMLEAQDSYDRLSDTCRDLQAKYEAEQARLRAEAEERRKREAAASDRTSVGGSGGVPA